MRIEIMDYTIGKYLYKSRFVWQLCNVIGEIRIFESAADSYELNQGPTSKRVRYLTILPNWRNFPKTPYLRTWYIL